MKKSFLVAVLMLGAVSPGVSQAEQYLYHPDSRLYLGAGTNPKQPGRAYLQCLKSDRSGSDTGATTRGAVSTEFEMKLVRSREELDQTLNVSAKISASGLFYSAKASVDSSSSKSFSEDSLTWVIHGYSDYGMFTLKNPVLDEVASEYACTGPGRRRCKPNYEALISRCGTEVVTEERRSVRLAAIVTLHSLSESEKSRLSASFSGSMKWGGGGGKVSAAYDRFVDSMRSASNMEIRFFAIGGAGITHLKGLLSLENGENLSGPVVLAKMPKVMHDYMSGLTASQAPPTEFRTVQITAFAPGLNDPQDKLQWGVLTRLYYLYLEVESRLKRLEDILYREPEKYRFEGDVDYREIYSEHAEMLGKLKTMALACYSEGGSSDCRMPTLAELPGRITWPKIDVDYVCDQERRRAYDHGLISMVELGHYQRLRLGPVFIDAQDPAKGVRDWARCELVFNR